MHTQPDRLTCSCLLYLHVSSWRSLSSYVLYCYLMSYHWSSLASQVSWIQQTFRRPLLPSSVAIVVISIVSVVVVRVQVKCLRQWLLETTSWPVQVVHAVGDVTVHVCKWSIVPMAEWTTLPAQVTASDTHHPCTRCKACQRICALTLATLIAAALCSADPDLVSGGGSTCMFLFPPAPTCTMLVLLLLPFAPWPFHLTLVVALLTFAPNTCGGRGPCTMRTGGGRCWLRKYSLAHI